MPERQEPSCLPPLVTLLGANRSDRKRPHRLGPPGQPVQAQDGRLHDHMNLLGYDCDRLSIDLRPEPAPMNGALASPVVRRTPAHRSKHHRETPALLQTIKANSEDSPGEARQQRGHRHLGVKQGLVSPNVRIPSYLRKRIKLRNRSKLGRKDVTTPSQPSRREPACAESLRRPMSRCTNPLLSIRIRIPQPNDPTTLSQRGTTNSWFSSCKRKEDLCEMLPTLRKDQRTSQSIPLLTSSFGSLSSGRLPSISKSSCSVHQLGPQSTSGRRKVGCSQLIRRNEYRILSRYIRHCKSLCQTSRLRTHGYAGPTSTLAADRLLV